MKNSSHKLLPFEGLRGLAAFAVVVSHLRLTFYPNSSSGLQASLGFLPFPIARLTRSFVEGFYNGTFAVWLFWIMSAFVLSLQFFLRAKEESGPRAHDYLEDASWRRYPRLFIPVMASVLFAWLLHAAGAMHNVELSKFQGDSTGDSWIAGWYRFSPSLALAIRSAAWDSFFDFDPLKTYNGVLWSMEKELYGSLFLFAFLALLGHRRSRLVGYIASASAAALLGMHWLNAFVAGIALCDFFVNGRRSAPGTSGSTSKGLIRAQESRALTFLLWVVILMWAGLPNYRGVLFLPVGTAAVALTLFSRPTQRLLSSAIPVFLGRISFGLYLVHLPFLCSFSCWAFLNLAGRIGAGPAAAGVAVISAMLSIGLGYLLYLAADRPSLKISRRIAESITGASRRPDAR